jgi:hypothetical protein
MQKLFSLFVLMVTACAGQPVAVAPDVVHARAHNGGSSVSFSQSGELLASGGWEGSINIRRTRIPSMGWYLPTTTGT